MRSTFNLKRFKSTITHQDLGPFGSDVASDQPFGFVTANSNCGDNARPYYEEYEADNFRYIVTSGVPDHAAECGAPLSNPNVRCKMKQFYL